MPMDYSPERWADLDEKPVAPASDVWRRGINAKPINQPALQPARDGYQLERDRELEQMRQAIAKMGLKP